MTRVRASSAKVARPDKDVSASVDAIRRILRELRVMARKSELANGLSAAQAFVLSALSDGKGMSVNDVAEATLTDRTSVASVIDRLVELGYVVRVQSPEDRRRAVISPTPLGRRALRRAAPPPAVVLVDAVRALKASERRSLAAGLTALTRTMGIINEPAGMLFEEAPRRPRRRPRRATGG